MNHPKFILLLLKQGNHSLEAHTVIFAEIANIMQYLDNCLCSFYHASLNTATQAKFAGKGPQESFAAFVEWVLASCNSALTLYYAGENLASPTLDPEPSLMPPHCAEQQPEPAADGEPEPAATDEPSLKGVTELRIDP